MRDGPPPLGVTGPQKVIPSTYSSGRSSHEDLPWCGILPLTHLATGGAYDSHHRTAGIAGRTRRRGRGLAGRGAGAAVGADAAHRRASLIGAPITLRRIGDIPAPGGGPVGGAGERIWAAKSP